MFDTVCPPAKLKPRFQPFRVAVPVLRMVISPWNPPGHSPTTRYPTEQPTPGVGVVLSVVTFTVADRVERLPAASRA